jgi:cell division septal protein FtsQ
MEFKPRTSRKEEPEIDPVVPPEKSREPRKKSSQRLSKGYSGRRRMVTVLKISAQIILWLALTGLIVGFFHFAYTSESFALRTITIEGCSHTDPQALETMLRRNFPAILLRIDLPSMRSRLEQESWIKRVEIRRILPSDLVIKLQERVPSIILEMAGNLMVADNEGILLDRYDQRYGDLDVPVLQGLLGSDPESYRASQEENGARVRLGAKLLAELESGSSTYAKEISEVDVSDKSNLRILLVDDTAEIYLGDRDFLKRFRRLLSNMDNYRDVKSRYGDIVYVDLRVDGRIIYKPRAEVTASAVKASAELP